MQNNHKDLSESMEKWTLDRFEGDFAVLENEARETCTLPRHRLPRHTKTGAVLLFDGERFHLDANETAAAQQRIQNKFDRLRKK